MNINKIKKGAMTLVAVVCGIVASSAVSGDVVNISYAGNGAIDSVLKGFDMSFSGEGDNIQVTKEGVNTADALNSMIRFIKWIALGGSILLLGVFVLNLIKMGTAGTNVQQRTAAQQGLVWSGISAAILSISTTIFFFLQSALT